MHNIKLNYPIESSGENISELNMRRSKVKDRLVVAKMKNSPDEEKEIRLFANLCEVQPAIIEELDESDYADFTKSLYGFFQVRGDITRAIIILSKITNWRLSEILELTEEEFCLFYDEAIIIQKESQE